MFTAALPKGGKKEADMIRGLEHLQKQQGNHGLGPKRFQNVYMLDPGKRH